MHNVGATSVVELPDASLELDPLAMSAEQMREIGYQTIELLIERLTDPAMRAMHHASPRDVAARINSGVPAAPTDWGELLGDLDDNVLAFMSRLAHPGYFAFIPASGTFAGALGDLIASALDIDAGSWRSAAGPSQLELVVLDWFKDWIGYPAKAAGSLVGGGSAANLTALACARESLHGPMSDRLVAYMSDQTHSSVARAARLIGFAPERVRILPTDERYRLRVDALLHALDEDTRAGLRPLVVVANAGATNTGAVDPLRELAQICRARDVWLHVDAAYGGFAAMTQRGRKALAGLELADSVTLDPHKWLYQPIECGCVLVREGDLLSRAFAIAPDYLSDYRGDSVDFCDLGMQLTRTARALKIWLSLGYFGVDAFRAAIDRALDLARLAERLIVASPTLELLCPPSLGVVCFRRKLAAEANELQLERANAELVSRLENSGRGLVSSTRLHGRYAVRMCIMNHSSGPAEVEETLRWFATAPLPGSRMTHGRLRSVGAPTPVSTTARCARSS